jgi:hypothetical protein
MTRVNPIKPPLGYTIYNQFPLATMVPVVAGPQPAPRASSPVIKSKPKPSDSAAAPSA